VSFSRSAVSPRKRHDFCRQNARLEKKRLRDEDKTSQPFQRHGYTFSSKQYHYQAAYGNWHNQVGLAILVREEHFFTCEIHSMSTNRLESLLPPDILGLPVSTRLVLVEQLWDSIADDQQGLELTAAQKAELDRRLELQKASPLPNSTWEAVKERLLSRS
jgi:putative addiction module component (TIGR02574 family)